jgi:hypothetical protein
LKRKADFLVRNVGKENLIVPLGANVVEINGIVILNKTGCFVWKLLEHDLSIDDLAVAVATEYNIEHVRAYADIRNFLDAMAHMGLLE